MTQKVAFKTIGCKVNQYETGTIKNEFIKNGYQVVEFKEKADVFIINTCAVTSEAERKSKQMIRKAARVNPSAAIIVTGCGVQSNLQAIKECQNLRYYIIGNYYKEQIFSIFHNISLVSEQRLIFFRPAGHIIGYTKNSFHSTGNRIRGLVKIQDGCNQFCSYCVIPYLRGRSRSRSSQEIISEIHDLASHGHKEIVLLGINLGSYGNDLIDEKINLSKLIQKIEKLSGIERIRLSSIEMPWVTDELIETFNASPKLCYHLHIPLQSGDDNILSLMNRKYTTEQFKTIIKQIRSKITDIAITTDVIVGFPGEDDNSFHKNFEFIKDIAFAKIHVFPYSDRPFSLASFLPSKIEPSVIKKRSQKLIALSRQLRNDFFIKNIGKEKDILVEYQEEKNNLQYFYGLTDNYIKVGIKNLPAKKGDIVRVRLKELQDSYLEGESINYNKI